MAVMDDFLTGQHSDEGADEMSNWTELVGEAADRIKSGVAEDAADAAFQLLDEGLASVEEYNALVASLSAPREDRRRKLSHLLDEPNVIEARVAREAAEAAERR